MKKERFIIHLQLTHVAENVTPLNTEIAFTHEIELIQESWDTWKVRRPGVILYVSGEYAEDALASHIAFELSEKGLDQFLGLVD